MKMAASRSIRPFFTLMMMAAGAFAGGMLAIKYFDYLEQLDLTIKSRPGSDKLFGVLPVTAVQLPLWQKALLYGVVVLSSMMLALVIGRRLNERLARLRRTVEQMPAQDIWAAVFGLVIGLVITALISAIMRTPVWLSAIIGVVLCYLGVSAMMGVKEELRFYFPSKPIETPKSETPRLRPKILDTNVIIDGRIADICHAGFVEGPIYVPRFVLDELQQIADSGDSLRRARGRRGLDILNKMRKEPGLDLKTYDTGPAGNENEVDAALVRLAQEIGGVIITNDFNLNKVAELQGVKVLNVNELANAVKPIMLPGEEMRVTVIKEGTEPNQGIGYLDDGTMIVVEGGKRFIGETVDVVVTSLLQTVAGKMIFVKLKGDQQPEEEVIERSVRSYSGGRQRRKIR